MASAKILITGGAGFLGRAFLRHHLAAGDEIVAVDDLSSAGAYWVPGDYDHHQQDLGDFLSNHGNFDRAYHFAAPVGGRIKIEQDPLYNADSLRLDSLFFRWAIDHTPTAVYPSSSAVYPVTAQAWEGMALREDQFDPEGAAWGAPDEMYGFTKLAGEILAAKARGYGLNTLVIRPFSGYGEEQSFDYPVPSICRRAVLRQDPLIVWGSGQQKRDFIHIDDIVGATVEAVSPLTAKGVGAYTAMNLGSGTATSFVEIARLAASIEGYDPDIKTDESKPVGVSARYCDPSRMNGIYQPQVSLKEGLTRVMDSIRGRKEV